MKIRPYLQIARFDHWFKNVFMLAGTLLAWFMEPNSLTLASLGLLAVAVVLTGFVASSNYVINEILDAPKDKHHPEKRLRPIPSGQVNIQYAYIEWILLGILGVGGAFLIVPGIGFGLAALWLWVMGCLYNIPPFRTKEIPYLDVLSESVNNPIRLLLGWFVLIPDKLPPISLCVAYWMLGAFLMAIKRFAEYRRINDPSAAAEYRSSFKFYDENRLLVSTVYYGMLGSCFAGVFIVRYHLELVFFLPIAAGFIAYYLNIGLKEDSPVQYPERLMREPGFIGVTFFCLVIFVGLMLIDIPALYDLFNVEPSNLKTLFTIGDAK